MNFVASLIDMTAVAGLLSRSIKLKVISFGFKNMLNALQKRKIKTTTPITSGGFRPFNHSNIMNEASEMIPNTKKVIKTDSGEDKKEPSLFVINFTSSRTKMIVKTKKGMIEISVKVNPKVFI